MAYDETFQMLYTPTGHVEDALPVVGSNPNVAANFLGMYQRHALRVTSVTPTPAKVN